MAKLYTKDGWIDFEKLEKLSATLNIVLAPRNSGKTYGKMLYNHNKQIPYIFMRTTQQQIDTVFVNELSPFEKLNKDIGSKYCCMKLPGVPIVGVYGDYEEKDGQRKPIGAVINFALSLANVGNIRGFNLDYIPELLYDEFVKHNGEIIRNYNKSDLMYFDAIVTLNRAREITGKKPLKQWLFGNTDNLGIPILQSLNLVNIILNMRANHENYRKLQEKDIAIFLCDDSPASKRLAEISTIANILQGTEYYDMAYKNSFAFDDFSDCIPQNIKQYEPLAVIDGLMVMEHKSKDLYYIRAYAGDKINGVQIYTSNSAGKERFKMEYGYLYFWMINNSVYFSSYNEKLHLKQLLNIDL